MNSQVTSLRESHMTPSNGILLPSRSALWFHKDDTLLDQAKFHTYTKKQVYPWHYPISYCIRNHNHTFKQDPRHLTIAAQKTIFMSDAAYSTVLASHHRYFIAHSLIYISLIHKNGSKWVFIWTYNLTMHHLTLGTDKENIKSTIESYQGLLTGFWVGAKMTLDLPSVGFATPADAGDRCQPGQVLEN